MIRWAAPVAALLCLGCQTALDLERARGLFRGGDGQPEAPVLVESSLPAEAPLEGPRALSGQLRKIPLSWQPVLTGDVAGYVVERATDEEGPYQRVGVVNSRFEIHFLDEGADLAEKRGAVKAGLGDGATYAYRVRAYDSEGRIVAAESASAVVTATTAPAPSPPDGLQVYSRLPRRVALRWNASEDPTVAGYVVYRSPTARGDYLPIARITERFETSYTDRPLGDLRVFYYRVAAVNSAGGEGDTSPARRAVTKPEPLPPADLAVVGQGLGRNLLEWKANVEPDVAGYRVLRWRAESPEEELVAVLPPESTRAEDVAVGAGEQVTYRVVAFDSDGLESSPSDPVEVESVTYGLTAEAREDAIELHWDPEVQAELASTRILLQGTLRSRELASVPSEGYAHQGVEPGRYRYRLIGVRPDGSQAPPSRIVEVELAEADVTSR